MTTHLDKQRPSNGQLILVPHKDTIRLLEVYVKRSLSLNDGTQGDKVPARKEKWVTIRQRRHSSDPSLHLADDGDGEVGPFAPCESPERAAEKTPKKPKKPKRPKKPSLWKSFLGLFSHREDEEPEGPAETPATPATPANTSTAATTATSEDNDSDTAISCLPPDATQRRKTTRRKSLRRRFSTKRLSVIRPGRRETTRDLSVGDITGVEAVVSVEPTYAYYEKVSEELEKILHEVKEKEEVESLTDEEVINRIIELTKEEGDAIDGKITSNPALSGFFQRMSYSSFQRLADAYLEKEATPTHNPPTVLPTAPELVKLAFTLDFTARVVGLSRQNIGHITGLGNRYLHDRFEYKQACTENPWSDSDD